MTELVEDSLRIELAQLRRLPAWPKFKGEGSAPLRIEVDGNG